MFFSSVTLIAFAIWFICTSCVAFDPNFDKIPSIIETASDPWPHTPKDDNLCLKANDHQKIKVVIIMASDRRYYENQVKCLKEEHPVVQNTEYADFYNYALRMYIDDDIPFLMKHKANAMQGELRKIVGMADALHPEGPRFGYWTTKAKFVRPDAVMWVDGDASLRGLHGIQTNTLSVEEVVRRGCARAEYPLNYVRILGQDAGNNVNAGWYLVSGGVFGAHFLNYLIELAEIYEPCGMWGQQVIQEALLVVMAGTSPDKWPLVLPCSGEKYHCFNNHTFHALLHECGHEKECVIHKGAAYTNSTNYHLLEKSPGPGVLNGCFVSAKWEMSPNAKDCYDRSQLAIAAHAALISSPQDCKKYCCAPLYPTPRCNNAGRNISEVVESSVSSIVKSPFAEPSNRYWGASGSGVVLLNMNDPETQFNYIKIHTQFLWHRGHGKLDKNCEGN